MSDRERIRRLEAAVLELLERIRHLEAEAADRRLVEALRPRECAAA